MSDFVGSSGHPLKIAIVGTGIAGMSAAWLLNQAHSITVYEKNDRPGGHSNTIDVELSTGSIPIDTGFIVYNEISYPNLVALFDHLKIPNKKSEMSFSASLDQGDFEYAGTNLNGLLGQRRNIVRPRFWLMLRDILRFYKAAPAILQDPSETNTSLGAYLARQNYSSCFIDDHLLPMGAAIWSTSAAEIKGYPAQAFVRFFQSHGLLSITNRPQWFTVAGGSREYVHRITEGYQHSIRFGGVTSITRLGDKVLVKDQLGQTSSYDHIVLACHADEALEILNDADDDEMRLLGSWRYTENRAVLHCDPSLMPKRRRVWSSWNFLSDPKSGQLCVTYWMNRLQSLETDQPLFVTLNPIHEPVQTAIHQEIIYSHPYFDQAALSSQSELWSLQGRRRSWFCGSYFGYGFHEDALQSGLAVAEQLGGIHRPWNIPNENHRINVIHSKKVSTA